MFQVPIYQGTRPRSQRLPQPVLPGDVYPQRRLQGIFPTAPELLRTPELPAHESRGLQGGAEDLPPEDTQLGWGAKPEGAL